MPEPGCGYDVAVGHDDRLHWAASDNEDISHTILASVGLDGMIDDEGEPCWPTLAVVSPKIEPNYTEFVTVWSESYLYESSYRPHISKRYYAGERQLALKTDDRLYYTLFDPTGTSLTLIDESGEEAAHLLYDAFGRVLANSFSADDIETVLADQGNLPDPDTGLVHLGQGRFYDPSLGRPLQPNPVGGPPTVPQALNRYAATPVGQPGVMAAVEAGFAFSDYTFDLTSGSLSEYLGRQSLARYGKLKFTASKTALSKGGKNAYIPSAIRHSFVGQLISEGESGRFIAETSEFLLVQQAGQDAVKVGDNIYLISELKSKLPKHKTRKLGQGILDVVDTRSHLLGDLTWFKVGEVGIDLVVGFASQFAEDVNNPYLSPGKVFVRSSVASIGGAIFAFQGAEWGLAASPACGPFVEICAPVFTVGGAIIGAIAWSEFARPVTFRLLGLSPADRNLHPLQ